jgi:hypothetical protein
MAMEVQPDPVVEAIRQLRDQVRWKPGKARQHLAKRIALGHLPPETTVADYEALIRRVVQTPTAEVFVYRWGEHAYPTVVAEIDGGSMAGDARHGWHHGDGVSPGRRRDVPGESTVDPRGHAGGSWGMNRLLAHYGVAVQHPEVSGAEHLEMLQIRDQLAGLEATLTAEEKAALDAADRTLAEQAHRFHQELQRFIDLAAYRREQGIPPERWWWYLDVVRYVPRRTVVTPAGA